MPTSCMIDIFSLPREQGRRDLGSWSLSETPRVPATTIEASWCALALAQRPSHLTFHACLLSPADRSAAGAHCGDRPGLGQHCACAACSCLQVFVTCSAPPNHVLQQVYKRLFVFSVRHGAEEEKCCSSGGFVGRHEEEEGECNGSAGFTH